MGKAKNSDASNNDRREARRSDAIDTVAHLNSHVRPERPVITEQHHKDRVDIGNIVRRWAAGGPPPAFARRTPQYGDFTRVGDYIDSLNRLKSAESEFNELPAHTRARFKNRLENALDFMAEPENHQECIDLGLIDPDTPPPILKSKAVPATARGAELTTERLTASQSTSNEDPDTSLSPATGPGSEPRTSSPLVGTGTTDTTG